jgi:hypothetical protein
MGVKLVQTNFSSGEVDPLLDMRHDTGAYVNGARKLRNVALLNQGGVARRAGTTYLNTLTARTRLIPFEFSSTERYIFAFSNTRLDVYGTTGSLITTLTGCPWTTAILFSMTFTQAADVMIVCHQTIPMQKIIRTGSTTFTRAALDFTEGVNGNQIFQPYYKFAADSVTLSASATTGSGVTITASAAGFTADYVGLRLRWFGVEILITAFTSSTVLVGTIKGTLQGDYDIDPFRSKDATTTIEVTHANHGFATGAVVTISGANGFAGILSGSLNGARTITVIDDNLYTFVAGSAATSSLDGGGPNVKFSGANLPTRNWEEPSFSVVTGYAGACTFHESRLWLGGSSSQPDALWASKINQFFNFDVGEGLDNESIQVTIGSDDISNVKHLVSNRHLQIFTSTSEFYIPRNLNTTVTPANITINRQTPYGCADIPPHPFDGATVYVQATLKAVREFIYTDAEQAYNSAALTILSDHLIQSPFDMAVSYGTADRSEQYLLLINNDGTMAIFHSARAEKLAGWTLWSTDHPSNIAKFDSVVTIGDKIYVSVLRDTAYYLEQFASDHLDLSLDCSKAYTSGSPQTVWTVDAIYQNRLVSVVSGNYYLGDYTVNGSNQITLTDSVSAITVGFNYDVEIETLPVHVQLPQGAYTGRPKRIARVILGLNNTLAVSISGNKLIIKQVTDDFSLQPTAATGKREFFLLGFKRDATVVVTQSEPLPMRLLGLAMEVSI